MFKLIWNVTQLLFPLVIFQVLAQTNIPFTMLVPENLYSVDSINHQCYQKLASEPRLLLQDVDIFDYDNEIEGENNLNSVVTLRLYGNTAMGYYYVTLFFGSPLQKQNLIMDTGSTITTIPCKGIRTHEFLII